MTSSPPSWIWADTTSGLARGTSVIAWRVWSVWVPSVLDQAAFSSPFISRSSDRGYLLFFVVTPPAGARNTTPAPSGVRSNHSLR